MSFYKEVPGRKTTLESTLKFDTEPKAGSMNPVTSDGVASAITESVGSASDVLQQQIDDIAEKAGSGYTPKGEATVATLNGLSGQENGELYTMTDAGTLTDGSLAVVAGDTVAWDATNSVWYKAMAYAPRQYGTNEVHNLATTITAFRAGDYIAVDGTDTAKMAKDDLLKETAEKALAGKIAYKFDASSDYPAGYVVEYAGRLFKFNVAHLAGPWTGTDVSLYVVRENIRTCERDIGNALTEISVIKERYAYPMYNCVKNPCDVFSCTYLNFAGTSDRKCAKNNTFAYSGNLLSYGENSSASTVLDIRIYVKSLLTYGFKKGDKIRIAFELNVSGRTANEVSCFWITGNTGKDKIAISQDGTYNIHWEGIEITDEIINAVADRMIGIFVVRQANAGNVKIGRVYIGSDVGSGFLGENNISMFLRSGVEYVVDKNGGGDFTKLSSALYSLRNAVRPIIRVKAGIYDFITELGSQYFENLVSDKGLVLNNGMHLIFEAGAKITCNYTGNNANVNRIFAPLNFATGADVSEGFTIEGMDIEASNVRCCVHDDCGDTSASHKNKYINCRMKLDNSANPNWSSRQCIGGGVGRHSDIEIINCIFESVPSVAKPNAAVVSYHNSSASSGASVVNVRDCYVVGNSDNIVCRYYGTSTEMSHFVINNCSLPKAPAIEQEDDASVVNFDMVEFCNDVRNP